MDEHRGTPAPRICSTWHKIWFGWQAGLFMAAAGQLFLGFVGAMELRLDAFSQGLILGACAGICFGLMSGALLCRQGAGTTFVCGLLFTPFSLFVSTLALDPAITLGGFEALRQVAVGSLLLSVAPIFSFGIQPFAVLITWWLRTRLLASVAEKTVVLSQTAPRHATGTIPSRPAVTLPRPSATEPGKAATSTEAAVKVPAES